MLISWYQFVLIDGMEDYMIHSRFVLKFPLGPRCPQIPDFDRAIFARAIHPCSILFETKRCHVWSVAIIRHNGLWIVWVHFIQANMRIPCSCNEALVCCYLKRIHLTIWIFQSPIADTSCCFPEPMQKLINIRVNIPVSSNTKPLSRLYFPVMSFHWGLHHTKIFMVFIPDRMVVPCCGKDDGRASHGSGYFVKTYILSRRWCHSLLGWLKAIVIYYIIYIEYVGISDWKVIRLPLPGELEGYSASGILNGHVTPCMGLPLHMVMKNQKT